MAINLKSLIGKLDDATRNCVEAAAGTVPYPHALFNRDRALSPEAARFARWRFSSHSAAL